MLAANSYCGPNSHENFPIFSLLFIAHNLPFSAHCPCLSFRHGYYPSPRILHSLPSLKLPLHDFHLLANLLLPWCSSKASRIKKWSHHPIVVHLTRGQATIILFSNPFQHLPNTHQKFRRFHMLGLGNHVLPREFQHGAWGGHIKRKEIDTHDSYISWRKVATMLLATRMSELH